MIHENVLKQIVKNSSSLEEAEGLMQTAGVCTFGIEYISVEDREIGYVNLGNTYDLTICEEEGEMFVSSWGAWVGEAETAYEEATDTIQCGWCGFFNSRGDEEDCNDVVCGQCGHLVGGS